MAIAEPGEDRFIVERDRTGLRIAIPAAIQTFGTLFLCLWVSFWVFGEILVLRHVFGGGEREPGLYLWLAIWTAGGASAIYALLWQLAGMEIIELNSTTLCRRRRILFFSRSKEFAVAGISNMRLAPPQPKYIRGKYVISSPMTRTGAIAFDFGRSTHHLGHGLDETEARYVIAQLCGRVKSLGCENS